MKCNICGREMVDTGTHFECANIICPLNVSNSSPNKDDDMPCD